MRRWLRIAAFLAAVLWASVACAGWHVATTDHFVLYSEEDPATIADALEKGALPAIKS